MSTRRNYIKVQFGDVGTPDVFRFFDDGNPAECNSARFEALTWASRGFQVSSYRFLDASIPVIWSSWAAANVDPRYSAAAAKGGVA